MAGWAFKKALLACIAATATIMIPNALASEKWEQDNRLKTLTDPIEFEILDVKKVDGDMAELKFAINVTSTWAPSSEIKGPLSLILQPPLYLKFVKTKEEFKKLSSTWTELVGSSYLYEKLFKLKVFGDKIASSTCSKSHLIDVLFEDTEAAYKDVFGIRLEEPFDWKTDTSVRVKHDYVKHIHITEIDSLEKGVYTWTGIFKNWGYENESMDLKKTFEDWSLALVAWPTTMPRKYTNWCIGASEFASQVLFTGISLRGVIVSCLGKKHFPLVSSKMGAYSQPLDLSIYYDDDVQGSESVIFSYKIKKMGYLEHVDADSHLISIYLPQKDKKIGQELEMKDLKDLFKGTETSHPAAYTVLSFDDDTRKLVLKPAVDEKLVEGKEYGIKMDISKIRSKLPAKGEWRFMLENKKVYSSFLPSVLFFNSLKRLPSIKFGSLVVDGDSTHKSCLATLRHGYSLMYDIRPKYAETLLFATEPIKLSIADWKPEIRGTITTYATSKHMLMLSVRSKPAINEKTDSIVVEFPKDVTYDGHFSEIDSGAALEVPSSYSYNVGTKKLTIKLALMKAHLTGRDVYVIPVPFISSKSLEDLKDLAKWKFELQDKGGVKIQSDAEIVIEKQKKAGKKDEKVVSSAGDVLDYKYVDESSSARFSVTLESEVAKDMVFTFKFSGESIDFLCVGSVISAVAQVVKVACDSTKHTMMFYVHTGLVGKGAVEKFIFHMRMGPKFAALQKTGKMDITVEGMDDATKHYEDSISVSSYFQVAGGQKRTILVKTLELAKAGGAIAKSFPACLSKESKIVTVPLDDLTHAVYYMVGLHDCEKPWMPGTQIMRPDLFSLDIANHGSTITGKSTLQEYFGFGQKGALHDSFLLKTMKVKRFMEHTLYVLFDKESVAILQKHLIAAKLCDVKDAPCKAGGEMQAIEMFVDDFIAMDKTGLFGDIILAYYDEPTKIVTFKRKSLFPEDKSVRQQIRKVEKISSVTSALESVLDDGMAHIGSGSMTESFSLVTFVSDKVAQTIKGSITKYNKPKEPSTNNGKQLRPIMAAIFSLKSYDVKVDQLACADPSAKFEPVVTVALKRSEVDIHSKDVTSKFVVPKAPEYEMYHKFNFTGLAKGVVDSKTPTLQDLALKGSAIEYRRTPQRDHFEIFFALRTLETDICMLKGQKYKLGFSTLLQEFTDHVHKTVFQTSVVFATCVKFDKQEGYDSTSFSYKLSYDGQKVRDKTIFPSSITEKVDGRCQLFTLATNLPKTVHFDARLAAATEKVA